MSSFFLPDIDDPLLPDPHTTGTPSSPYTTSDHRLLTRSSETPPTSPLDSVDRFGDSNPKAGKKALKGTHLEGDRLEKMKLEFGIAGEVYECSGELWVYGRLSVAGEWSELSYYRKAKDIAEAALYLASDESRYDFSVSLSGKVPLTYSWYGTRSHPSELTAGVYNTVNRDGYEAIAETFSRNSCNIILPRMDLSDDHQPNESRSSPELLLAQITASCRKHGVEVSGQNSLVSGGPKAIKQIKKNLLGENAVDLFTYQRMGAYFFSPDHFPSFTQFVQNLKQLNLHSDDLPLKDDETADSLPDMNLHKQVA
ncbi:unnamed protein product [Fraxinus pennsylvanica]|uniref:Beta-amylase n=1 Tax=Fraxinus pennsylvanica TaxID=56036 RepID=A0AAD2E3C4_9LAMI|nr:unnamed protein product [Fraxinus pennsylvanica]